MIKSEELSQSFLLDFLTYFDVNKSLINYLNDICKLTIKNSDAKSLFDFSDQFLVKLTQNYQMKIYYN